MLSVAWRCVTAPPLPRREQLLEAAAALFAERGYHAVGIDDIGAAAGISGPGVYRHFPSKQALLAALCDRALTRMLDGRAGHLRRVRRPPGPPGGARRPARRLRRRRARADRRLGARAARAVRGRPPVAAPADAGVRAAVAGGARAACATTSSRPRSPSSPARRSRCSTPRPCRRTGVPARAPGRRCCARWRWRPCWRPGVSPRAAARRLLPSSRWSPPAAAVDEPETVRPLIGSELVEALRDGGHVALPAAHAHPGRRRADQPDPLGDCSRQRLLDDAGRADARALGEAVRALDVPVGEVLASPFCRTVETAELAFGRVGDRRRAADPTPETRGADDAGRCGELLSAVPADGENTVLVGHLTNLRLLSTASPDEGGTVVFRPDGEGFVLVGSVPPQGWPELAARRVALRRDGAPGRSARAAPRGTAPCARNASTPSASRPEQETHTLRPSRSSTRPRTA